MATLETIKRDQKEKYAIKYKSAITGKHELSITFDSLEEAQNALEYRESIGSKGKIIKVKQKGE